MRLRLLLLSLFFIVEYALLVYMIGVLRRYTRRGCTYIYACVHWNTNFGLYQRILNNNSKTHVSLKIVSEQKIRRRISLSNRVSNFFSKFVYLFFIDFHGIITTWQYIYFILQTLCLTIKYVYGFIIELFPNRAFWAFTLYYTLVFMRY